MDIQKIISDLVAKLGGDKNLISSFVSDPLKAIKDLLGIDLDPSMLKDVVSGVTSKLGIAADDAAKGGKGILDKIMGLFKK